MWGTCFFDVWKLMMMRLEPTFGFTNVFHRQKKVKWKSTKLAVSPHVAYVARGFDAAMLHVLSLDGATVATLDASSELSGWQIRDIVNKNLGDLASCGQCMIGYDWIWRLLEIVRKWLVYPAISCQHVALIGPSLWMFQHVSWASLIHHGPTHSHVDATLGRTCPLAQVSPEQRPSIWCLDWSLRWAFPWYMHVHNICIYIYMCVSTSPGARSCCVCVSAYVYLCLYGSLPRFRCPIPTAPHLAHQQPRELCTQYSYPQPLVFLALEVCGRRSRCNTTGSTAVRSYDAGPDWSRIIMVHKRQFLPRFCQVFDGHMLHDGDLLSNSGEMIVTIVWRSSPTLDNWKMDMRQKVKWEKWMIMNSLLKWSHFLHFSIVKVVWGCA